VTQIGFASPLQCALLFILPSLCLLCACHSNPLLSSTQKFPDNSVDKLVAPHVQAAPPLELTDSSKAGASAQPIVSLGDSHSPRFSAAGNRLLFTSRSRPNHTQLQVYVLDFGGMIERRLTFHDGSDFGPAWESENRFYFASSTDEIKDTPQAINKLMRAYYPDGVKTEERSKPVLADADITEIYLQSLDGRKIERLTESPGFDGDVDFDPIKKRLVFSTSRIKAVSHLFLSQGSRSTQLTTGDSSDRSPRFAPDGKSIVWVQTTLAKGESESLIQILDLTKKNQISVLVSNPAGMTGRNLDPTWNPAGDAVVFASNRNKSGLSAHYNLYSISRDGRCLKQLTNASLDLREPAFRPDGRQIAFTSERGGVSQIYLMDYRPPADCLVAPTTSSH
jgi:Tol biopolymer transport system component